jgi:hypothetical protein
MQRFASIRTVVKLVVVTHGTRIGLGNSVRTQLSTKVSIDLFFARNEVKARPIENFQVAQVYLQIFSFTSSLVLFEFVEFRSLFCLSI